MGLILYIVFSLLFLILMYKLANKYKHINILSTLLMVLCSVSLIYYKETLLHSELYNIFQLYRYGDSMKSATIIDTFTFFTMLSVIFIMGYKLVLKK